MDFCHMNAVRMISVSHMLIGSVGRITYIHGCRQRHRRTDDPNNGSQIRKNKMNFSFPIFRREKDTRGDSSYSKCKMYSNINWTSIQSRDYHLPNATANQHPSIIGKYLCKPKYLSIIQHPFPPICFVHVNEIIACVNR